MVGQHLEWQHLVGQHVEWQHVVQPGMAGCDVAVITSQVAMSGEGR